MAPVPEPVVDLVDTWRAAGMPSQPPIAWPRARWLVALPEHETLLLGLPERLGREDVRAACRDAVRDASSAVAAFIAVMAWGHGSVGYGPHRTRRMLATPDAAQRSLSVARTLSDEGPLAAYRRMARADDCRLEGLGPAFGTKVLYFCQPHPAETSALILDDLVSFWLDCKLTFRLEVVKWSASAYQRYLRQMHEWAAALDCAPEDIERCIFQAEARRRGGQWAVPQEAGPGLSGVLDT